MFYRNWIFSTALSHVFFHFKVIRDIYKPYFTDIRKNVCSCKIATHFIDECYEEETPFEHLGFFIIDVANNISGLTPNQIEDLLLKTETFLIGTLVTQHRD